MKETDRIAIEEYGIDSLWLMENAAGAVAELAAEKLAPGAKILIFCGSGNNGGDGVAAARLLLGRGFDVECYLCGKREKMTKDTAANEIRLKDCGGELKDYDPAKAGMAEKNPGLRLYHRRPVRSRPETSAYRHFRGNGGPDRGESGPGDRL